MPEKLLQFLLGNSAPNVNESSPIPPPLLLRPLLQGDGEVRGDSSRELIRTAVRRCIYSVPDSICSSQ